MDQLRTKVSHLYLHRKEPKANGGERDISTPGRILKGVQEHLKVLLGGIIHFRSYAHGGISNHSTVTYTRNHRSRFQIMHVDIKNFYPSVKRSRVVSVLKASGCTGEVAEAIADFSWLERFGLPQGAPTSPLLGNAVLKPVYRSLASLAAKQGLDFDCLCDDILISADFDMSHLYSPVIQILSRNGYAISREKSGIQGPSKAQTVAGLMLNREDLRPGRRWMKQLSGLVAEVVAKGPNAVAEAADLRVKTLRDKVRGRLSYLCHINLNLGNLLKRKIRAIGWYF